MEEKGLGLFNAILAEWAGVSIPFLIAGLIDTLTLPVRLIMGLFIPDS